MFLKNHSIVLLIGLHDIGKKCFLPAIYMYIAILKYTGKDDLALFGDNYWGDLVWDCICIEIMLYQTDFESNIH